MISSKSIKKYFNLLFVKNTDFGVCLAYSCEQCATYCSVTNWRSRFKWGSKYQRLLARYDMENV